MERLTVYGLAYIDDIKEPLKGFKANGSSNFKIGLIHGSVIDINWDEQLYRRITNTDLRNLIMNEHMLDP